MRATAPNSVRQSVAHRLSHRRAMIMVDHQEAQKRQILDHPPQALAIEKSTVKCRPCPTKCDDRIECLTKSINYRIPCYPMYYIPWGVTWSSAASLLPDAYGLTVYANGSILLTSGGFVADPSAVAQILVPNLNYTGAIQPKCGDLWGMSGYVGLALASSVNSIYVVTNDSQPGAWFMERLSVNTYPRNAYMQVMRMVGPFENNVPRLVTLTNIICPNNTWEWTGTSIGLVSIVCLIYIRSKLRKCKCKCPKRRCRNEAACQRRGLVMQRVSMIVK